MTDKRDARLKRDWEIQVMRRVRMVTSVVDAYIYPRYADQWFPNSADFCLIDEFRALIMDPSIDDLTITETSFTSIESCIPDVAKKWRLSQDHLLLGLLPKLVNRPAEDHADDPSKRLELATTFFSCRACLGRNSVKIKSKGSHPIGYPGILIHSCFDDNLVLSNNEDSNVEILFRLAFMGKQPWYTGGDRVGFHAMASTIAHNVVTACGKDPGATTASEMDEQDARVECRRCSKGAKSCLVMTWRMAVCEFALIGCAILKPHIKICHSIECHAEKKGGSRSWRLLDEDDTQKARALEAVQLKVDCKHYLCRDFRCTMCGQLKSKAEFSDHLHYASVGSSPV
jgi:hypothetical protein